MFPFLAMGFGPKAGNLPVESRAGNGSTGLFLKDYAMISVLLAGREEDSFSGLNATFEENAVETARAESGAGALSMLEEGKFDLLLTDETLGDMTGIELISKAIAGNPMMNCAALSTLSVEDFHEATEGLGVMMPLPVKPGREDVEKLIERLKTILDLTRKKR